MTRTSLIRFGELAAMVGGVLCGAHLVEWP
jgi:hypothetical protein